MPMTTIIATAMTKSTTAWVKCDDDDDDDDDDEDDDVDDDDERVGSDDEAREITSAMTKKEMKKDGASDVNKRRCHH